jgi:N-acetylglucosamine kinase-like BadF-type ATPase
MTEPGDVVVAVDGGGSKTDAVALSLDGRIVAQARGAGSSPHFFGLEASVAVVDELVRRVAGGAHVRQADLYVSGLDLPIELERYRDALEGLPWAGSSVVVENDLFALLRAGTDEPDAVAVVCGTGINAVGVRADGATVRFPSLGGLSGDWGGGYGLGAEALWHAARAVDGRGPDTLLVEGVCRALGVATIPQLIEQLHFGERDASGLSDAAPAVFAAAEAGDAVAVGLVERQADEIVAFVRAIVTRLGLVGEPIPVVMGGGILETAPARLEAAIAKGVATVAPLARLELVRQPPIVGAALLALSHGGADASSAAVAREAFARESATERAAV